MRELIEPHWKRRLRLGRVLDYLAVALGLALALFFVLGWLYLAARLDCEHQQLRTQLRYCTYINGR